MSLFLFSLTTATVFISLSASANQVRFPDEELARESVLPVFDEAPVVMDRRVRTAGRFEVGPRASLSLLEVFNSEYGAGVDLTYNINEIHGINFTYGSFFGGKTSYAQAMERDIYIDRGAGIRVDLTNAPETEYMATLNYQFTSHYGKISLTKSWVMNLALFAHAGGGVISVGQETTPAVHLGIGQKFYFNNHFALKFGLQSLVYSGPNFTAPGALQKIRASSQPLKASDFEKEIKLPLYLVGGLVLML